MGDANLKELPERLEKLEEQLNEIKDGLIAINDSIREFMEHFDKRDIA